MERAEGKKKEALSSSMDAAGASGAQVVVALECLAGSSKAEEWGGGEVVQAGDVVEEIRIIGRGSSSQALHAPFKGGKSAVQKALHAAFKRRDTSIEVRVRSGKELQACILPHEAAGAGKKQYVLRSLHDPNYVVGLVDRLESECLALQGSRNSRVVSALSKAQLQDGYVAYPWEKKMRESLSASNLSCFMSLLVFPKAVDSTGARYESFEYTLARANTWLYSSQASGVPIVFMNIQTEALLTKISGETASATVNSGSLADLSNVADASIYGFEDYHGVDIGVVKAARLWYGPIAGELQVEIRLQEGDTRLGFAVSRTTEGFIYISSVVDDEDDDESPSTRSGLCNLFKGAQEDSKLLVISRLSNERLLPWMITSSGAVRCFDTITLSQKLSLHRIARKPILLHVLMWERTTGRSGRMMIRHPTLPPPSAIPHVPRNLVQTVETSVNIDRDNPGDISFRFSDFSLNNWV